MMFYKFFCIFNRKAKISKKLIFDKPEVPMTVKAFAPGWAQTAELAMYVIRFATQLEKHLCHVVFL